MAAAWQRAVEGVDWIMKGRIRAIFAAKPGSARYRVTQSKESVMPKLSVLALYSCFFAVLLVSACKAADNPVPSTSPKQPTGDSLPRVKHYAGSYYLGKYTPSTIKDWSSIPEPAKSRIVTHLKKRLGNDFYAKLSLVDGQIIDIAAFREKAGDPKNFNWEVAYRLDLRFSRPKIGIDFYDAVMDCRSDGSVVTEIDLPEIAKHPERAEFISTARACEIAKQYRFDVAKAKMELNYHPDTGVCVFSFTQVYRPGFPVWYEKYLDIDAHNGKFIGTYTRRVNAVDGLYVPRPPCEPKAHSTGKAVAAAWQRAVEGVDWQLQRLDQYAHFRKSNTGFSFRFGRHVDHG